MAVLWRQMTNPMNSEQEIEADAHLCLIYSAEDLLKAASVPRKPDRPQPVLLPQTSLHHQPQPHHNIYEQPHPTHNHHFDAGLPLHSQGASPTHNTGRGVAMNMGMNYVRPGPGQKTSYNDWTAQAEERRQRFKFAKNQGVTYNKGVILQVLITRGPHESGLLPFMPGRGRQV